MLDICDLIDGMEAKIAATDAMERVICYTMESLAAALLADGSIPFDHARRIASIARDQLTQDAVTGDTIYEGRVQENESD